MIEKYGGDFGRERLFSSFGMAIFSPITGILIDYTSRGLGYTDYSAAFYTYDILLIISTISVAMMPIGDKLPADNVFRDLFNLLRLPHVMAFILFLFFLGNFWGFIESFLFLYLKGLQRFFFHSYSQFDIDYFIFFCILFLFIVFRAGCPELFARYYDLQFLNVLNFGLY